MAFLTKQNVFDRTRILLGDSEVSGGQVYTDDGANGTVNLNALLATPYSEAFRHMQRLDNRFVLRDFFAVLAANQAYLDPASVGITNVGEVREIRTRPVTAVLDIAGVTPDPAASVCRIQTASAHELGSGDIVVIAGSVGGISNILGEWAAVVVDDDEFDILGCRASGSYTSGGSVIDPSGQWSLPLGRVDPPINLESRNPGIYSWREDVLRFPPVNAARLVKATYTISGALPSSDSDSLAPDDMGDYFAYRLAGLAAAANGDYETADRMNLMAVGPNPDEPSGFLGQILDTGVKALNYTETPRRFGRFRPRRRAWDYAHPYMRT